ncbi:MAG: hypothetical protein V1743_05435 [Nanoarchaeota archaeon]
MREKRSRKSQAALEFLMTYGWGLIVLAAIFGTLSYFGVFSGTATLVSKCITSAGVTCRDFKATDTTVMLTLRNNFPDDLTGLDVEFIGDVGSCDTDIINTASGTTWIEDDCADNTRCFFNMTAGEITQGHDIATFQFTNCNAFDKLADFDININYQKKGEDLSHTATGKATLKVES